jgi:tRNA(Ile)-lysidine synthase
MPNDPVSMVRAAVRRWNDQLGPCLFGLACSGGADSIALADAAIAECGTSNVLLIHVDHGLREGSAAVAAAVSAWARSRGVATVVRNVVVEKRASIEAAARDARYAALEAAAREVGCSWTFLGHTARDQAETVLMRIVRGTGPAGLAGIPTMRGRFIRPLLEMPRAAIEAYVAALGLPTWEDPMNDDANVTRVRFRQRYLPALRTENPALDDALVRLATSAREWMNAIEDMADPHGQFPIDCRAMIHLPVAVRKYAYTLALEAAGLGYDATHIDAIEALVVRRNDGERSIDVPGGRIVRSYDTLDVATVDPTSDAIDAPDDLVAPAGYDLRVWEPGDRMKPARLKGRSRKLSDLFIDAKVPRASRQRARVVIRPKDGVIVWAEHIGLAHGETDHVMPLPNRRGEVF